MIPRIHAALSTVADVVPISTSDQRTSLLDRAAARLLGAVSSRGYLWDFGVATSIARGRSARRRVRAAAPDVVLGVVASTDLAFIGDVGTPIVQVSDATFAAIRGFYPMFSNLHPVSSVQAEIIAERSARATDVFLASSQWAIDSLMRDYAVGSEQCVLAPTGPGIDPPVAPESAAPPSEDAIHALLVSSNWHRKGGDVAVDAVRRARERGVPATLTIVGDAPAGLPEWVRACGRLDAVALGVEYERADLLLELASANAAGVTLTDAAAHGLPVVAANVGGVASIVRDGETGILVAAESSSAGDIAESAADAISRLSDSALRSQLSATARSRWATDLNWDEWTRRALSACVQALEVREVRRG